MESIELRAAKWALSNDTGASSKAICRHMLGMTGRCRDYPHDHHDLGRCLRLLDAIPEWRDRIPEMAQHSGMWAALVKHWGELEDMHRRNDPGLYKRMQEILRPAEDQDRSIIRLGPNAIMRFGG